jgi:CRP-like cAMP-binding protein
LAIVRTVAVQRSNPIVGASLLHGWVVPAAMFLLVVVVAWLGWRWIRGEHLAAIAAVPLFAGLSDRELLSILSSTRAMDFQPGASIVTEGETGKGFFVVTKGRTSVKVSGAAVATLDEGSYFGEMAALDGGPRAATITAETAVTTLELTPSSLRRILDREPAVARSIFAELRRRLEEAGDATLVADDGSVTSARLVELSQRLRRIEHPDWAQARSPKHRWLGFSRVFARGE